MAFTQHGSTSYKFGFEDAAATALAAAIGLKPQTMTIATSPQFQAEAQDELGGMASVVTGPEKSELTMSGYVTNESTLRGTKSFSFDSRFYIVTGIKIDTANTEFRKGEVTAVHYDGISAPVVG